jgi:hypothetical protein
VALRMRWDLLHKCALGTFGIVFEVLLTG